MSENEDFKVTDRRATGPDADGTGTCREGKGVPPRKDKPCYPPVAFSTFLLSLAASAMVQLGESPEPETGQYTQNLALAKHTIDILAMLQCKTRANATDEEAKLLADLLCQLRLSYVKKTG
ncbi:DUF1844 domain-containing protein [Desulfolutivibrio sulfoxidireducens]|uniref:DUF1844 domain-containing protein n=1 Tax=Desulfolutivibrio sulfoxidireducens TaxID=2773299 RepID=UPI00159E4CC7|nr:DUF1844 domain-containing protein [Desulfolutivibrio sulfoxidireducens]QLA15207.1 DUF1844 domain-containing protein [Desulfolutivibrio sulfoxidireducens]QLA18776.1 DUF1844 domain-containing protein [Desulfolutivibrio sulfoxidireducens]